MTTDEKDHSRYSHWALKFLASLALTLGSFPATAGTIDIRSARVVVSATAEQSTADRSEFQFALASTREYFANTSAISSVFFLEDQGFFDNTARSSVEVSGDGTELELFMEGDVEEGDDISRNPSTSFVSIVFRVRDDDVPFSSYLSNESRAAGRSVLRDLVGQQTLIELDAETVASQGISTSEGAILQAGRTYKYRAAFHYPGGDDDELLVGYYFSQNEGPVTVQVSEPPTILLSLFFVVALAVRRRF